MKKVPKRRFKGFLNAGDWEQRKLGECMNSFAYGLNAAAKGYDGMHKYIRITDIDDETHNFIQSNLASPDIDFNMDVSHYKLNVGDIVFARTGASVGKTYLYNPNDGDLYYAGFLIRGKVKEDCDSGFIYQNTLTKDYDSFIKITSQRSGQPGVNSKEYAIFRLNIPCKDEQEKISKVLNSLDELFTLHQRKLEKLQATKKALLYELFPIENSRRPKLRFKGFTGDWEQRKLISCIQKVIDFRGRTPNKLGMEWSCSGHLALSALNVKDGYIDFSQDNHYGDNDLYEKWMTGNELHKGQVVFTTEAPMGNVAQIPDNERYILSQRTVAFCVDENIITENFLAVLLRTPVVFKTLTKLSSGGTAQGISQKSLAEIEVRIPPNLHEQQIISNFLLSFEHCITLHQRKLEKLKNLKAAYLNEMFV